MQPKTGCLLTLTGLQFLNYVTAPPACYLEALRSNKHDMQPKFSLDSKGIQPGMAAQPMRTCSLRPAAH